MCAYRGPALTYKIRKTTINNNTGDNFSITIPRFVAQQFEGCLFRLEVSGNSIIFTSGCKITMFDIEYPEKDKKINIGGTVISLNKL